MEIMLDELPQAPQLTAIFNTAMYNEKPANIYIRYASLSLLTREERNTLLLFYSLILLAF